MKYLNPKFIIIWFKYLFSKYSRYRYIFLEIIKLKPKTILEVGVYKGQRSREMLDLASKLNNKISYYGFDLFEDINKGKIKKELSKKPFSKKKIQKKLSRNLNNVEIKLFKGDTKKTLKHFVNKNIKVDFVFIDGGHSLSTIDSDWKYIKKIIWKNSVVIFDDYYSDKFIIKKFGCNNTIQNLNKKNFVKKVLPSSDYVEFSGAFFKNSLVKVTHK